MLFYQIKRYSFNLFLEFEFKLDKLRIKFDSL